VSAEEVAQLFGGFGVGLDGSGEPSPLEAIVARTGATRGCRPWSVPGRPPSTFIRCTSSARRGREAFP